MLQVKLIHLKKNKNLTILIDNTIALKTNYNLKYLDSKKTSRLRFVFSYISVFSRCG